MVSHCQASADERWIISAGWTTACYPSRTAFPCGPLSDNPQLGPAGAVNSTCLHICQLWMRPKPASPLVSLLYVFCSTLGRNRNSIHVRLCQVHTSASTGPRSISVWRHLLLCLLLVSHKELGSLSEVSRSHLKPQVVSSAGGLGPQTTAGGIHMARR